MTDKINPLTDAIEPIISLSVSRFNVLTVSGILPFCFYTTLTYNLTEL